MASLQKMLEEMLGRKSDYSIPETKAPESTKTYLDSVDYSTMLGGFNSNNPMVVGSAPISRGGGFFQQLQMPKVGYDITDIVAYINSMEGKREKGWTAEGDAFLNHMLRVMGFVYNDEGDSDDTGDDTGSALDDFESDIIGGDDDTGDDDTGDDYPPHGGGGRGGGMGHSDIRLKENIELVGNSPSGVNIYEFDYKNKNYGNGRYRGVMAQEVPESSFKASNGYLMVDYSNLDVKFKRIR